MVTWDSWRLTTTLMVLIAEDRLSFSLAHQILALSHAQTWYQKARREGRTSHKTLHTMTLCVNKTHRIVHRILGLQTCMSERLLELFRAPGQRTTKPWLDSFLPLAKLPWSETPQLKQWNLCPPAAHGRISTILSPTLHQLPFGHPALYGTGVHFANADLANHLHQSEMQRLCSKSWSEAITLQSAEGNLSCWHSISIPFWEEKCWRHVKCAKAKSLAAMETMGSSDVLKLFEARKDIFWDLRASGLPRMKGFVGGASAVRIKYNIQIRPDP